MYLTSWNRIKIEGVKILDDPRKFRKLLTDLLLNNSFYSDHESLIITTLIFCTNFVLKIKLYYYYNLFTCFVYLATYYWISLGNLRFSDDCRGMIYIPGTILVPRAHFSVFENLISLCMLYNSQNPTFLNFRTKLPF